jgi:hypothetical protein
MKTGVRACPEAKAKECASKEFGEAPPQRFGLCLNTEIGKFPGCGLTLFIRAIRLSGCTPSFRKIW